VRFRFSPFHGKVGVVLVLVFLLSSWPTLRNRAQEHQRFQTRLDSLFFEEFGVSIPLKLKVSDYSQLTIASRSENGRNRVHFFRIAVNKDFAAEIMQSFKDFHDGFLVEEPLDLRDAPSSEWWSVKFPKTSYYLRLSRRSPIAVLDLYLIDDDRGWSLFGRLSE
jgi:hypothetical protein